MSGLSCSACSDPRRPEIDAALLAGDSLRDIAGRFGTSKSALSRHRPHVGRALVRAAARKGERFEETLLQKVERLEADARRLGKRAEEEGDIRCALAAVREMGEVVKLLRELTPAPKPSPADVRRVLEWYAEEADMPVAEYTAEIERISAIRDAILAGANPPHTEPHRGGPDIHVEIKIPAASATGAPAVPAPALTAPPSSTAPPAPAPPVEAAPPAPLLTPPPAPARPAPTPIPTARETIAPRHVRPEDDFSPRGSWGSF